MLRFVRGRDRRSVKFDLSDSGRMFVLAIEDTKTTYRRFRQEAEGIAAYHAAIATMYDEGFALELDGITVEPPPDEDPFVPMPALEAAVEAAPDSTETWLVLADAWAERGDPRGPCIHLSRAFTNVTDPAVFAANKRAAAAVHHTRTSYLFGPLGRDAFRVAITYAHGLPATLAIDDGPGRTTDDLMQLLRASPFCRFVR